jgi:hypothetical protein
MSWPTASAAWTTGIADLLLIGKELDFIVK